MIWSALSYPPLVTIDLGVLSVSPHGIFTAVGFLAGSCLGLIGIVSVVLLGQLNLLERR
ncbi:hypothetical protein [Iamia sp.]|uniref:hypothetical protein n=1 Tax=Iamia sp. TaxID=2722710 RepID=UPI002CBA3BB1|nr:hypothetical protein [Iamia sp.]HXH58055.1 hypothetical protein [Iamia sp.]